MLASRFRLSGKKNFEKAKRDGKFIQSQSFGLVFLSREDKDPSRFGFVVSKKVSRKASQRNKAKRALSEAIRLSWENIKPGYDIIFLAKQTSLGKPAEEITKETKETLFKAGLIKK